MKNFTILWFFVFMLFWNNGLLIKWLSLQHWNHSPNMKETRSGFRMQCNIARRRYGFAKLQAKICKTYSGIMPVIQKAAIAASETCQKVFQERRWNCSSIAAAPYFTTDLIRGTREQSFVYAISSAALTFSIARACASGNLHYCTCANKPNEAPSQKFQWGGCGDNLKWGIYFSKKFIDHVEKASTKIAAINLHNSRVGRRVIRMALRAQCKCHGVSGSCNVKTCWKSFPPMIEIGEKLFKHYMNGREVTTNLPHVLENKQIKRQLVYISKSPDYCNRDLKLGSFGTTGRKCNVSSNGSNSCRQLCCGRGYKTVIEEKLERCECKYYDCCYVKCNICKTKTEIFECG